MATEIDMAELKAAQDLVARQINLNKQCGALIKVNVLDKTKRPGVAMACMKYVSRTGKAPSKPMIADWAAAAIPVYK